MNESFFSRVEVKVNGEWMTAPSLSEIVRKDEFMEWLKSKSLSDTVGIRATPGCCPLAMFIRQKIPDSNHVDVCAAQTRVHSDIGIKIQTYNMPVWASQFIHYIDCYASSAYVTAGEAESKLRLTCN